MLQTQKTKVLAIKQGIQVRGVVHRVAWF